MSQSLSDARWRVRRSRLRLMLRNALILCRATEQGHVMELTCVHQRDAEELRYLLSELVEEDHQ